MSESSLPDSLEEKHESYRQGGYIEHWLYVHELRAFLDKLEPTDWLVPNGDTHNLVVGRGDDPIAGVIDFHFNGVIWFGEEDE